MNRYQRNYDRAITRSENRAVDSKNKNDVEEVLPPRERRKSVKADRFKSNRSCNVRPSQKDESLITDGLALKDEPTNLIWTQYDLDPDVLDEAIKESISKKTYLKTHKSCQYVDPMTKPAFIKSDGCRWQSVNNVEDLDTILNDELNILTPETSKLKNVHISQVPRIKSIAQKFSKFKKNNVELRKLEERIVCVEYDVFADDEEETTPIQTMRAFFSVKPIDEINKDNETLILPSLIKHKFHITEDDLGNLKEKEIEMIDAKVPENKPYLDDLKRVLERQKAIYEKKNKSTLDLMFLYEKAKRECPSLDENYSDTNFLSKAELEEIKNLITNKCASSVYGIRRRTVKSEKENTDTRERNANVSESIYAELTRNLTN